MSRGSKSPAKLRDEIKVLEDQVEDLTAEMAAIGEGWHRNMVKGSIERNKKLITELKAELENAQ